MLVWHLIVFVSSLVFSKGISIGNGSYNSFRYQTGYCKLQSFHSESRQTTGSVPMFLDGRIAIGVGLNNHQFQDDAGSCGRCLRVDSVQNMPLLDTTLTTYDLSQPIQTPFYAMVMDQCKDAVCTEGYLDFDIYSPLQPVEHGNPYGITWEFVPCPVSESETVGVLVCLNHTCQAQTPEHLYPTWEDAWKTADPYYIAFYFRNTRFPIQKIRLHSSQANNDEIITNENGWIWRPRNIPSPEDVFALDIYTSSPEESHHGTWRLKDWFSKPTEPGYHGGLLVADLFTTGDSKKSERQNKD